MNHIIKSQKFKILGILKKNYLEIVNLHIVKITQYS